jgi:thiamine biosynthesis lipoprotein
MMNRRKLISAALGLGALAATARVGFGAARGLEPHQRLGLALGTKVSLLVLHADAGVAQQALAEAMAEIQAVDALMTLYREDSQIARLNRTGRLSRPDPRVVEVLSYANGLSARSGGAFDVTVQPLWLAYSAASERGGLPSSEAVADARTLVDWRRVRVSDDEIRLEQPGMAVTLNGVAQGYAADRALAALRRHGVEHALIDAGEFDTLGRKANNAPWTLGIRDPRDADALAARLTVDARALATSGDYETFFTPDFLHHHIFDPATGDSPTTLSSVSVLAPNALQADGLSTAFMVLGVERSLALAAALPGVDALLIGKDGRHWRTPGLPEATS